MNETIERLNRARTALSNLEETAWTNLCAAEKTLLAALAGDDDDATLRATHAWKNARHAHAALLSERDLTAHQLRVQWAKERIAERRKKFEDNRKAAHPALNDAGGKGE